MCDDASEVVGLWRQGREQFEVLSKREFDELARTDKFADGPWREDHSEWMRRYGPYSPERWAFGELADGRLVCANITRREVKKKEGMSTKPLTFERVRRLREEEAAYRALARAAKRLRQAQERAGRMPERGEGSAPYDGG